MSSDKAKRSAAQAAEDHLQELRVDSLKHPRRHSHSPALAEKPRRPKISSRSTDYVFVNSAFVGSTNNVAEPRIDPAVPVTSVIREQYWACSKWSFAQRVLVITVAVLVGAVVGLAVAMAIQGKNAEEIIGGIFPDLIQGRVES